jgi:hypothetical protein
VIVLFVVDIGEIVDHHFLFITIEEFRRICYCPIEGPQGAKSLQ